jgi:anaerobic selenocysteine-containing dehydrogenase
MNIKRREFLNLLGVAAGAAGMQGCSQQWAVPDHLVELALRGPGLDSETQAICGLCAGGCGLRIRQVDGLPVGLKGNRNHPLNRGGLCPVGQSALELLYSPNRIKNPLRRTPEGDYRPVSWDEAVSHLGSRLNDLRESGNGDRVALLNGESSLLFKELAQQFMAALGSPHIALLEEVDVLPYQLAQGIDRVPGIDLSGADLVLSLGLDLYEDGAAPLHAMAAMIGSRDTEDRGRVLHVGTRFSPSAAKADQFVPIQPGTHAAFALGVAHVVVREGYYDPDFLNEHTSGFEDWAKNKVEKKGFRRLLLEQYYPDRVAQLCGCPASIIVRVARRFGNASKPVALAGGEAVRGDDATWNVLATQALNALVGSSGKSGGVVLPPPIPLTPMPDLQTSEAEQNPSIFLPEGNSPFGSDPVQALSDRVLEDPDPIEVLLVVGWNPVYENPAGKRFAVAMDSISDVVVLSSFFDETCQHADWVLPVPTFLEGWTDSVAPPTVPFSTVGVSKPVIDPLYESYQPGDVLLQLCRRLPAEVTEALPWEQYEDYLRSRLEGLAASGQGSVITGSFEENWRHFLEERGWRFLQHQDIGTFWDSVVEQAGWWSQVPSNGDWDRMFQTSTGRYEFYSHELRKKLVELGKANGSPDDEDAVKRASQILGLSGQPDDICLPHFEPPRKRGDGDLTLVPFRPLTARGRFGVHSPMVMEMFGYSVLTGWETWAELSPETAHDNGVDDGDIVALESEAGSIEAVVRVHPGAISGTVHVPLGLGRRGPGGEVIGSNPVDLASIVQDPLSGTLSLNSSKVRLRLLRRRPHGGPAPLHKGDHV